MSRLASYNSDASSLVGQISVDGIVIKSQEFRNMEMTTFSSSLSCIPCRGFESRSSVSHIDESPYHDGLRHVSGNVIIPYGRILNVEAADGESVSGNSYSDNEGASLGRTSAGNEVILTYVKICKGVLVPDRIRLCIDQSMPVPMGSLESTTSTVSMVLSKQSTDNSQNDLVEDILNKSYLNAKRKRNMLVIINPNSGKGTAKCLFMTECEPILRGSRSKIEVTYTKYPGHATDIARECDISKYDTIVCASGDGIPYEVINGLNQRPDRAQAFNKLAITQLPCGSGNAMSVTCHWSREPSFAALCLLKGTEARVDLMACSQPSYYKESPKLSFLSQTFGIIAESDIDTECIRWMGPARFDLGVAINVFLRKRYPCEIYVKYVAKEKEDVKAHFEYHKDKTALVLEEAPKVITDDDFDLKYPLDKGVPEDWVKVDEELTNNLGIFYTGKMPYIAAGTNFFPAALPSDGAIDLVMTDARTSIAKTASLLTSIDSGHHVLDDEIHHSKVLAYKLIPKVTRSMVSIDGEQFPVEPLQVEILPQVCKTILRNGHYVDSKFDSNSEY